MSAVKMHDFLKPCPPIEIIKQLNEYKVKNPSLDIKLDIFMGGNLPVSGYLLKYEEGYRNDEFLILTSSKNATDLMFVQLDSVTAVRVYDIHQLKGPLTFNSLPEHMENQKTFLQAKRAIAELKSPVEFSVDWASFSQDSFVPNAVYILCQSLATAFQEIQNDKIGKQALQNMNRIEIRASKKDETYFDKQDNLVAYLNAKGKIPDSEKLIELLNPYLLV